MNGLAASAQCTETRRTKMTFFCPAGTVSGEHAQMWYSKTAPKQPKNIQSTQWNIKYKTKTLVAE